MNCNCGETHRPECEVVTLRSRIAKFKAALAEFRAGSEQRISALTVAAREQQDRIAKLEAANAALVDLCEEYQAQWGDDYLAQKWGLKETLAAIKREQGVET